MLEIQKHNNAEKFGEMLKKVSFKFPVAEISQKTGYSKGSISEILKGKRSPTSEFLEKFAESFEIDIKEYEEYKRAGALMTTSEDSAEYGKGMLNNVLIENTVKKIPPLTGYYYPDVSASAGLETEMINDELKKIPISIPPWGKDLDFINVYGDSMYPKYCPGEIIGIKEVEPQYVDYGYAYVVILNDGQVFLKYVNPGSDNEHWILSSENPTYQPKEYHLSLIRKIFIIKVVLTKTTM